MLNKTILMGRLTQDPELRATNGGSTVCSFCLAVEGREQVSFLDCVAWGRTAEFLSRNFSKGKLVALCGRLQSRTWEDKSGGKRKSVDVVAEEIHFCGDFGQRGTVSTPPPSAKGGYLPGQSGMDGFAPAEVEDDLPF